MKPEMLQKKRPESKTCSHCGVQRSGLEYIFAKSWFYSDGLAPVCNRCIKARLAKTNWHWNEVDKLCQLFDIPFIPREFVKLYELNGDNVFTIYAQVFWDQEYEHFDWKDYYLKFRELEDQGNIEKELPKLDEFNLTKLRRFWGHNYDNEELYTLEDLFRGLVATQGVTPGTLQEDNAKKACKISLEIDKRLRAGEQFDKLIDAYSKIIKIGEFTPKNVKNEDDFDSFGQVALWLEKRGWINDYFDDVSKDIVDESINNITAFNQRLFTHEPGMSEEIKERIEMLRVAKELELTKLPSDEDDDIVSVVEDWDVYENEGYEGLTTEEFNPDDDDDSDVFY